MNQKEIKAGLLKIVRNKYLVAAILFLAFIIFFDENSIVSHQKNRQRLNELIEQKEYYKEKIVTDKQKLEDLNSGVHDLEKFAREQYLMKAEDEEVFVLKEEE